MSDIKTMPLICLRCKKYIPLSMPTFKEISYTHYSYCEECLRKGLKALRVWDEAYQQIYDHHYEILKEEASEGRNAKLSLSNWILDLLTGYDIEGEEVGKWIKKDVDYYKAVNEYGGGVNEDTPYFVDDIACSKCLKLFSVIDNETERFNYCPNCGAEMSGGGEDEEEHDS